MFEFLIENIQSVLVFMLFLGILVSVHEWGHFITAKKLGVQVDEFALGFGPTLFSRHWNETTYLLKLFPLGGYVRMAGDERGRCEGKPEEFFSQSIWRRSLIVLNGPVVNFVLAYVCLFFVFMLGYPESAPKVGDLLANYPAQEAGLLVGDKILEIDGRVIESWSDIQLSVSKLENSSLRLLIDREGQQQIVKLIPKVESMKDIFGKKIERKLIGIVPSEEIISLRYGPGKSLVEAGEKFWEFTVVTCKAIYAMLAGSMSAKENVGGPVFIFQVVKNAAEMGFSHFLFILGVISLNLAIFNLLPVIPLDGGHLMLFAIEKIRGKPLPPKIDTMITNVGVSMIIVLALFIFYVDFERIGLFEKIRQIFL